MPDCQPCEHQGINGIEATRYVGFAGIPMCDACYGEAEPVIVRQGCTDINTRVRKPLTKEQKAADVAAVERAVKPVPVPVPCPVAVEDAVPSGRVAGVHWKPEEAEQAKKFLMEGKSNRETAKLTGLAKNTVQKIRDEIQDQLPALCACGRENGHRGWCKARMAKSPARQQTMKKMHATQLKSVTPARRQAVEPSQPGVPAMIEDLERMKVFLQNKITQIDTAIEALRAVDAEVEA